MICQQLDMFSACTPTVPPYLNPLYAAEVRVWCDIDRDHIGAEAIGRCGNNAIVYTVKVYDADGETLYGESAGSLATAEARADQLRAKIRANQPTLF